MSCNFFKFYWISFLLFSFNSHSFAQKSNEALTDSSIALAAEDSVNSDYENVTDTFITKTVFDNSNDSISKWKRGREFNYMVYLDSLLKKKKDLKNDTVSIDQNTTNKNRTITNTASYYNPNNYLNSLPVKFFFWALAIFFIGFFLYKLFFTGGLFAKSNAINEDKLSNKEPESPNQYSEYNLLIHEAELKNDFNLSIRYLYLQSLKKLADSGLIVFSPEKANTLYVQELTGRNYQRDFSFLTSNYEYVWYGRFIIDEIQYRKLKDKFILFNKKV